MTIRTALLASVAPRAFDNVVALTFEGDEMLKRSKDSASMLDYYDLSDALIDGLDALVKCGEKYLPKFDDECKDAYEHRLKATKFTNVYRDIVENLAAKPFQEECGLVEDKNKTVSPALLELTENIDGSGNNLTVFAGLSLFNAINSSISWIFVDAPVADPNVRSMADAKKAGVRPFWSHVLGRNVLSAKSKIINGDEVLTYVKILEPGEPDHIRIFERSGTGGVTWALYVKSDKPSQSGKTQFILENKGVVGIGVIPLVPVIIGRRDGRSWKVFPAMRDAADLAKDLYQQESGLKFAKILTAYPMLVGVGVMPSFEADGKTVKRIIVGPNSVLYGGTTKAGHPGDWKYIEPSATSLKFLAEEIDATMQQLRELGRQPLTAQSGNLTVITTAVAAAKARSAVKAWALVLKDALENAFVLTCAYMGIKATDYDPTIYVFTEFDEFIDGKDLETLDADRDRGDISRETLLEEKKRRGVYGPEFSVAREDERLLAETPSDGDDANLDE